jgi:uncharacterized NAD(P)/FAD-binding protein YdhS
VTMSSTESAELAGLSKLIPADKAAARKDRVQFAAGTARRRESGEGRDDRPRTRIAIIGLGAWGLAVLERLLATAEHLGGAAGHVELHVVEPKPPGYGVYSADLPDYVIMNTPCGQISMHPGLDPGPQRPHQLSLWEWAVREGYRWHGDRCLSAPGGRALTGHDFVPRALVGRYLNWYFERLVEAAPPQVRLHLHRTQALDVSRTTGGERVYLASGQCLEVDEVVLTVGHAPNRVEKDGAGFVPYDSVFSHDFEVASAAPVAVAGMGLASTDVVMALTRGRGGRFLRAGGGFRYLPSGREPRIRLYSRSGLPQCAKAVGMRDVTTSYRPSIWTQAAVAELRTQARRLGRHGLSWSQDLHPLLVGEMTLQYYVQASLNLDGAASSRTIRDRLTEAWSAGTMASEVDQLVPRLGHFDPEQHLYPFAGVHFNDPRSYQTAVGRLMSTDLREALRPGGSSPVKMAFEVLRFLRDEIRQAVDFGGLDLASHMQFCTDVRGRINRLVQGPPAERVQQLLALLDAGIISYPYGPDPTVQVYSDGRGDLEATHLANRARERVAAVICGFLADPNIDRTASQLLASLRQHGRLTPMRIQGSAVGSVQLTRDSHPVAADGTVQHHLWLFGAVTEGARYFTNVIPSPGSRVGPFQQAARLSQAILQRTQPMVERCLSTG